MRAVLSAAVLSMLAAPAGAAGAGPSGSGLSYVSPAQIRAAEAGVPPAAGEPQDRITKINLLPIALKDSLLGYGDTRAQLEEGAAFWKSVLEGAGLSVGAPVFKDGMYRLPYTSPDGRVVRRFLAEPRQFKPKDESSLRENMAFISGGAAGAGMSLIASYVVNTDFMLPTYALYYLTAPAARAEEELQLRILDRGEDIDFEVLEGAGLKVLQKPQPWIMVYAGPEVGMVSRIAKTREELDKKVAERVAWLESQGKRMIGTRVHDIPEDPSHEYRFLGNIYFYQ